MSESTVPDSGSTEADAAQETAAHVVEFILGDERCAMDIDSVDSIVETKQITRIPRAPEAVEGVMELRGETTAVVDPKQFLSVGDGGTEENILVLDRDADNQKIGIRVNDVMEVRSYPEAQVDRSNDLAGIDSSALAADLVTGVIRKHIGEVDEDGIPEEVELVLWIDIEELVDAVSESGDGSDNQL